MITLSQAFVSLNETKRASSTATSLSIEDNLDGIFRDATADELVSAKIEAARLQAEYDANAYARSRKTAYDALNQLELISDDAINGTTTHADAITAIKAEFPKPV